METRDRASELEHLEWFYNNVEFGPADSEVGDSLNKYFMDETGKNLPDGYNYAQDGETIIDR